MVNRVTFTKEERIQQLQDACDSIKENAADFIGNEPFPCNWTVQIEMKCHEAVVVRVIRDSIPHEFIKRLS